RLGEALEQVDQHLDARLFGPQLEQRLLPRRRQLDPRRKLERELRVVRLGHLAFGAGGLGEPAEDVEQVLHLVAARRCNVVDERLAPAGQERAALGGLRDPEPLAALDHDVESTVREPLQHLGDTRARPDLFDTLLVLEDEPELALELEALADQLPVARLEDVERYALRRDEHDPEREEADLLHERSVRGLARASMASWRRHGSRSSCGRRFRTRRRSRSRTVRAAATTSR